ncbi:MAG: hypothetical protein LBV17_12645 [Treponema sp.]|jgi:hypothetical protein|nr:hypothetical protein [Treponema sp.]
MSRFLTVFLVFFIVLPVFGLDLPVSKIPDDSLLRLKFKDSWLMEVPARVLSKQPVIEYLPSGERVQVSALESKDEFMVLFSRELISGKIETDNNPAVPRRATGQFPGWAQGSWMITRRKNTGEGSLIRIFLRSDQYTYIQFRPFNSEKCQMDAVVYGGYIVNSLPVAVSFERLYSMQLNDILKLAGDKFPVKYFEPQPAYYKNTVKFITNVRKYLGPLRFADDGAIDENGNYVFINNLQRQPSAGAGLNCSGFTKWLIDGILRPVTGARLSITPLKAPFGGRGSSFTENWEQRRDPYFGLDWIRNLASEANGILRSNSYRNLDEFEVRNDNFSLVLVNENKTFVTVSYPGFLGEAGYGVEGLYPLLYTLAIDNPFKFYLSAVNNEIGAPVTETNLRGAPRLRQYFHVAALIPYFDEYGVFKIVVFESAAETSFTGFRNRYPGHYINLVQIPVVSTFDP